MGLQEETFLSEKVHLTEEKKIISKICKFMMSVGDQKLNTTVEKKNYNKNKI